MASSSTFGGGDMELARQIRDELQGKKAWFADGSGSMAKNKRVGARGSQHAASGHSKSLLLPSSTRYALSILLTKDIQAPLEVRSSRLEMGR